MTNHYDIIIHKDTTCADCGTVLQAQLNPFQGDQAVWIGTDPEQPNPVGRICCPECAAKVEPLPTITVGQLRAALDSYPDDAEVIIASVFEGMVQLDDVSVQIAVNGPAVQLQTTAFVKECL